MICYPPKLVLLGASENDRGYRSQRPLNQYEHRDPVSLCALMRRIPRGDKKSSFV